jgi:hypothetical protein
VTEHEDLRPRPSSLVEYLGIAYTLGVVMEKLKREGKLSPGDARPTAFFTPAEIKRDRAFAVTRCTRFADRI